MVILIGIIAMMFGYFDDYIDGDDGDDGCLVTSSSSAVSRPPAW